MTTLLLVHAHPDDESILTGGVIARAHQDGHRVVLVTATRGEEGEVHNIDGSSARHRLAEIRTAELQEACEVLGVDRHEFLGFRDSGLAGRQANRHPESFHAAPLTETVQRLAPLLREERADVVVTYAADGTYGHPDHVKAYSTTMGALDVLLAADAWQPSNVFGHAVPRSFVGTVVEAARLANIELPEELAHVEGVPDDEITHRVDVTSVLDRKLAACVAHLSQMHPGLPLATIAAHLFEAAFGTEYYVQLRGAPRQERPGASLL